MYTQERCHCKVLANCAYVCPRFEVVQRSVAGLKCVEAIPSTRSCFKWPWTCGARSCNHEKMGQSKGATLGCAIAGGCVMIMGLVFGSCLFCTALVRDSGSAARKATAQARTQPEQAQDKRAKQAALTPVTPVAATTPLRNTASLPVQQRIAPPPAPAPRPAPAPQPAPRVPDTGRVCCCDGTVSPTCTTVHRGCCSRHGGVCGCN
jgi:hypothetical protein